MTSELFGLFKEYLSDKAKLSAQELDLIKSYCFARKIKKKQFHLQEGDYCRHASFVVQGCLRVYRVSPDGTEHTLRFATENWWTTDKESYLYDTPATLNIEAIEDTYVLLWSKDDFTFMLENIPELARLMERLTMNHQLANQKRLYNLISLGTEERYEAFVREYPNLLTRVPIHMIASFIGVKRETLSRVRNQYLHKQLQKV